MKVVKELSIKEIAQAEVKEEAQSKAVKALKELYKQKASAELIVRNIDRQIEDYLAETES